MEPVDAASIGDGSRPWAPTRRRRGDSVHHAAPAAEPQWRLDLGPCGSLGGNLPEGVDPTVLRCGTFGEAASLVKGFTLQLPGYVPRGWKVREVHVFPQKDGVAAVYATAGEDALFLEAAVEDLSTSGGRRLSNGWGFGMNASETDPIMNVKMGEQEMAWMMEPAKPHGNKYGCLIWESHGFTFQLRARGRALMK